MVRHLEDQELARARAIKDSRAGEEIALLRSELKAALSVLTLSGYEPRPGESIAATIVRALGDYRTAGLEAHARTIEAEIALATHLALCACGRK